MKLSSNQKLLIGLATFWTPLYLVGFILYLLYVASRFAAGSGVETAFNSFGVVFALHILTILVSMGLRSFYVAHTSQNPHLTSAGRFDWKASFMVNALVTQPLYYLKYVLKDEQNKEA